MRPPLFLGPRPGDKGDIEKRSDSGIIKAEKPKEIPDVSKTKTPRKPLAARDVTKEYLDSATPGKGFITYDDNYKLKGHQAEISAAEWVHSTFGGDIRLLVESPKRDVKTPDYLWNGKKWELKGVRSINGADKSLQHAIKQIQDNPGGVILDILEQLDMKKFERQILGRFLRSDIDSLDIMLLSRGELLKILRHEK